MYIYVVWIGGRRLLDIFRWNRISNLVFAAICPYTVCTESPHAEISRQSFIRKCSFCRNHGETLRKTGRINEDDVMYAYKERLIILTSIPWESTTDTIVNMKYTWLKGLWEIFTYVASTTFPKKIILWTILSFQLLGGRFSELLEPYFVKSNTLFSHVHTV